MSPIKKLAISSVSLLLLILPGQATAGSVGISPLRQEIVIEPGQSFNTHMTVHNPTKETITVNLSAESFGVINENYDYSFAKLENNIDWIQFKNALITLGPKQTKSLAYTVGIPNNTEPGGKYIAIFAAITNKTQRAITSIDRAGQLLYITVSGKITKRGEVLSSVMPVVTLGQQIPWSIKLHSTGSAHFRSKINTEVSNIFGQVVGTTTEEHLLLPNTVRKIDTSFKISSWPGLYRVKVLVGLGDDPAKRESRWILYMPMWFLVAVVILVLATVRKLRKIRRTSFSLRK